MSETRVPLRPTSVMSPQGKQRTPMTPGMLIGIVTGGVLTIGIPAFLLAEVADVGRSDAWPITFAVLLWAGVRLAVLVGRGGPRMFDMFFWLFTYIFLGLAPTIQIRSDKLSMTTPGMDPTVDFAAALLVVVGLLAYELGRVVALRSEGNPAPKPQSSSSARHPASLSETRVAILFLGGAMISVYFTYKLGFASSLSSREAASAARRAAFPDPAVRAIFTAASLYPLLIATGALLQLRREVTTAGRRRLILLCVAVCLMLIFSVVSPISSARYALGTVLFAVAAFFGALASRSRIRTTMIATFLGFLFVFPIADAFRREAGGQQSREGFFGEYLYSADYDGFWQIANAYTYWRDGLVEPLQQFSGVVFFWVPRSVWASKPTDTGALLADYRGYAFSNLSSPLWAEALVNGGIIALIVVFLILGFGLRRLDTAVVASSQGRRGIGTWAIVAAVFPVFMTILLRGSLLQATGALVVATGCVLFIRSSRPNAGALSERAGVFSAPRHASERGRPRSAETRPS